MLSFTVFTGRLTHDPELRKTESGTPVATFRIAVQRDFVKKGNIDVDFFDIVAWRATAEFVSKYFSKGKMITVTGRLKNRKWKDKEGNERITTELQADRVYFGEKKNGDDQPGSNDINPFDKSASAPEQSFFDGSMPREEDSQGDEGAPPWED